MKKLCCAITAILAVSTGVYLYRCRPQSSSVMSLLKSEPMAFLVTRQITTQIVIEESSNSWYSQSRAVMWATVRLHYGCDLKKLSQADVHRDQSDMWVVKLPPPELLSFEVVDINSISKDTLIAKIDDVIFDTRDKRMMEQLRYDAMKFAKSNDLLPTRDEMAAELNQILQESEISAYRNIRFE